MDEYKNDDMDYKLYVLAELRYKKEHPGIENEDLFPADWYSNRNYKLKTEIIASAIKNNISIEEVPEYMNIKEGVIN
jgi:hypothetical protein